MISALSKAEHLQKNNVIDKYDCSHLVIRSIYSEKTDCVIKYGDRIAIVATTKSREN